MQTVKTINEFLVRWSDDGSVIQGLHIAEREAFLNDSGVEVTSRLLPPRAVLSTDADALQVVAAAINTPALAELNQVKAQLTQASAQLEQAGLDKATAASNHAAALETLRATLTAARDAALADAKALRDKYEAPNAINGVPQFVKKWQLMAGLRKDNLYAPVMAYISALPPASQDLWNGSAGIERTSPFLIAFKSKFQMDDAHIDNMFVRYAALTQADVLALG